MKKIMLMAFAATLISFGTQAQVERKSDSTQKSPYRLKQHKANKHNWQALNLTEAQKEQMKKNQEEFRSQRESVQNDASLTAEQKKNRMAEIQKKSRERMNSVLTEEQKAQIKDKSDKRFDKSKTGKERKSFQNGNKGHFGEKGLDLSAEQQDSMKEIRHKMKVEMDDLKNNTTLTKEQKKEQMLAIRNKFKTQMDQVLTPAQKSQIKNKQEKYPNKDNGKGRIKK